MSVNGRRVSLFCVDGQEGEVALCQSPSALMRQSRSAGMDEAAGCRVSVLILKFLLDYGRSDAVGIDQLRRQRLQLTLYSSDGAVKPKYGSKNPRLTSC
ncbi:hypothetical protein JOB18_016183 [Solea senegalensis]|uniref:Uncharacterized protein n=1 Tax=Solea senegalensis TaxID=28829 RepID=A0AAV6PTS6_SOLSE|nr:hypothetical protein JOB18_016183 [Solea senegalensis]